MLKKEADRLKKLQKEAEPILGFDLGFDWEEFIVDTGCLFAFLCVVMLFFI